MTQTIRLFLLVEAASFVAAGLVHFGVLASGYEHRAAGTAESIIGVVLLLGLVLSLVRPAWTRPAGLTAQASPPYRAGSAWPCWSSRPRS